MPPRPRRAPFLFPTLPSTWYIGHMSRALKEMQLMIQKQKVDLVIEARDARMPLTSINPAFEHLLNIPGASAFAKRLIIYNKADLAQPEFHEPIIKALLKQTGHTVLFTDSRSDASIKHLMRAAIKLADRPLEGPEDRISMLIAGMPNTGKSSILNALRRVGVGKGEAALPKISAVAPSSLTRIVLLSNSSGKAASVSSAPGHTRRLSTFIKISLNPPVYIHDTPGIMVPFFGKGTKGDEMALKLALTGGIKESLFESETIGDYLVWRLKARCEEEVGGYTKDDLMKALHLPLTTTLDSSTDFLIALADRLKAVRKGGEPDLEFAGRWLLLAFREGKLGRWTLDGLGRGGEAVDLVKEAEIAAAAEATGGSGLTPAVKGEEGDIPKAEEPIQAMIDRVIAQHLASIKAMDLSGHQEKKQLKADQAKLRLVKREALQIVQPKASVGPRGAGIQSSRRRKYRRH
ncbi:BZ3500_MvSof-1268-A1-R1_Chr5-2g07792 [Microbotryum saponariae]|uniref:BZ3500_MvSof-1268-A1-R1_Chr5-2g07792 protein n=1 Tax=Microbotryum saponariae TaxID=289078 RepID=A0A2X0LFF7_9BASI|nr:BZ3500_MvSof-1268-A1-R1_Chr5-2g07792 [Microbotryum saponariae]SDA05661.1 BZ3501_MvSof-1269-A2-R1_Chr5-2g07614 [Microbotryum saponariae]